MLNSSACSITYISKIVLKVSDILFGLRCSNIFGKFEETVAFLAYFLSSEIHSKHEGIVAYHTAASLFMLIIEVCWILPADTVYRIRD